MYKSPKTFFKRELPHSFFYSFSIFFALLAAGTVAAWTGPLSTPPACTSGNPGCDAPLNVSGNAQAKAAGLLLNTGGATNGLIVQYGNVGIGTVSPGAKLEVDSVNSAATNLTAKFLNPNTANGSGAQILIGPFSDLYMSSISAAGNPNGTYATDLWLRPRLASNALGNGIYISTSDNVGIGTVSPGAKLEVNGTAILNGGSSNNWASLNVGGTNSINALGSIYSYNSICVGNNSGHCDSTGGTVMNSSGIKFPDGTMQTTAAAGSNDTLNSVTSRGASTANPITTGTVDATGPSNNWAGIFRPNGAYGIYVTANSSGVYDELGYSGYGLNTNGAVAAYSNNANYWAGDFRAAGPYGMYVLNSSGYYAEIAYSSYGLLTNGSVNAAAFYYNSDERLKKNIAAIANSKALADVLALEPVTFNWIDAKQPTTTQIGFIAQQVEKVVPEIVTTNASTTMKAVDYARITPLLVGAAQAQQVQIEAQQKEIDKLQAEVDALNAAR